MFLFGFLFSACFPGEREANVAGESNGSKLAFSSLHCLLFALSALPRLQAKRLADLLPSPSSDPCDRALERININITWKSLKGNELSGNIKNGTVGKHIFMASSPKISTSQYTESNNLRFFDFSPKVVVSSAEKSHFAPARRESQQEQQGCSST